MTYYMQTIPMTLEGAAEIGRKIEWLYAKIWQYAECQSTDLEVLDCPEKQRWDKMVKYWGKAFELWGKIFDAQRESQPRYITWTGSTVPGNYMRFMPKTTIEQSNTAFIGINQSNPTLLLNVTG